MRLSHDVQGKFLKQVSKNAFGIKLKQAYCNDTFLKYSALGNGIEAYGKQLH